MHCNKNIATHHFATALLAADPQRGDHPAESLGVVGIMRKLQGGLPRLEGPDRRHPEHRRRPSAVDGAENVDQLRRGPHIGRTLHAAGIRRVLTGALHEAELGPFLANGFQEHERLHLLARGLPVAEVVVEGAKRRLRPVLMTASIAAFGLVPLLFATGPGSEIQRPLAIVVIGGLITSTFISLLVIPVIFSIVDDVVQWLRRHTHRNVQSQTDGVPAVKAP